MALLLVMSPPTAIAAPPSDVISLAVLAALSGCCVSGSRLRLDHTRQYQGQCQQ